MNTKLKLLFKDRIGIVADVSKIIAEEGFNIVSMEVERTSDMAALYLEVENPRLPVLQDNFFKIMGAVEGVKEMNMLSSLPHENREKRFRVVLDNISDGVISIDADGRITTMNAVARKMFHCEKRAVTGIHIREMGLSDDRILSCLSGEVYNNVRKDVMTQNGRFQFVSSCRPIADASGQIVGAVEICKNMQEVKQLVASISQSVQVSFSDFIGRNRMIASAIGVAQKIAKSDSIVSIRGESGTGKELFARAIHAESERKDGPFVPVNCAAIPETLLESELFGYAEGAFTGAKKKGKPGLFETAQRGTVFLDEIADLPLGAQAKILRIIQERRVRRLGSSKEISVDARVITATNRNLEQMMKKELFREDLYYRINVLPILIPPLRERIDDIPELSEHFLFQFAARHNKKIHNILPSAMEKLVSHDWPGNVRELKNVIERAAIFCDSDQIEPMHLFFSSDLEKEGGIRAHMTEEDTLPQQVAAFEKKRIKDAVKGAESIRKTAKELGISHTALINKLKKYGISYDKRSGK